MKLYVTRHGPAEDDAPSGLDGDRALSDAGRRRVRAVAKTLSSLGEAPLHLVTSPLVRAVQTAEIIAVVTKIDERNGNVEVRRELSPGGDGGALVRGLASERGGGRKRVMLVGHEPDLSSLVGALLGTLDTFERGFDKAMVVGLELHSHDRGEARSAAPATSAARLRFVLDPRSLRLDPDARDDG